MKITTLQAFFGQPVNIGDGKKIKFDHKGICEVDDKLGEILLEKYPSFMFSTEKKQVKETSIEQEINQELVTRLESEIYSLKEAVQEQKEAKGAVEADLLEWQSSIAGLVEKEKAATELAENQKKSYEGQIQALELKITLMEMSVTELKKLCEDSNYPKADWEKLSSAKLIEYILNK